MGMGCHRAVFERGPDRAPRGDQPGGLGPRQASKATTMRGKLFIHEGDDSSFVAKRERQGQVNKALQSTNRARRKGKSRRSVMRGSRLSAGR